jgi:hypothetical protein
MASDGLSLPWQQAIAKLCGQSGKTARHNPRTIDLKSQFSGDLGHVGETHSADYSEFAYRGIGSRGRRDASPLVDPRSTVIEYAITNSTDNLTEFVDQPLRHFYENSAHRYRRFWRGWPRHGGHYLATRRPDRAAKRRQARGHRHMPALGG